jgi:hypothetical protein
MAGPWDFSFRPQRSMADAFAQGVNLNMGQGLLDARAKGQEMRIQQQEAQQQALEFQQKQAALAQARQAALLQAQQAAQARAQWEALGPDATVRDMDLLIQQNPQALALPGFKEQYERQSDAAKKQAFSDLAEPFAALQNGDTATAIDLLDRQWAGYTNANDEKAAKSRATLVEMAKTNPEAARRRIFAMLSSVADKDQREGLLALDSADVKLRKDTAEAEKAEEEARTIAETIQADLGYKTAQTAQLNAQVKNFADRLKFDYWEANKRFSIEREKADAAQRANEIEGEKLTKGELDAQNDFADAAAKSGMIADRAIVIRDMFETGPARDAIPGVPGKMIEKVKSVTGYKDKVSQARGAYLLFKNEKVMDQLRGTGAVSNYEAKTFAMPFPEETDDPAYIGEYMDAIAGASTKLAKINAAKSQWQAANHSLGQMKREGAMIDLGDGEPIVVPYGMTFDVFAKEVAQEADAANEARRVERARARGEE